MSENLVRLEKLHNIPQVADDRRIDNYDSSRTLYYYTVFPGSLLLLSRSNLNDITITVIVPRRPKSCMNSWSYRYSSEVIRNKGERFPIHVIKRTRIESQVATSKKK